MDRKAEKYTYRLVKPIKLTIEYPPVIGMRCQDCVDEATLDCMCGIGRPGKKSRIPARPIAAMKT